MHRVIGYAVLTPTGELSGLYTSPPQALPPGFTVQEAVLASAPTEAPTIADKADQRAHGDCLDELARLTAALKRIEDFTTGYGDVAGIVCKVAQEALRPETAVSPLAPK